MARTPAQVQAALKARFASINPSIDLEVGVTWDYTLAPVPPELSAVESEVSRLLQFYASSFPAVATPQEAQDFASNFGISADPGQFAFVDVVFFRYSAPASNAMYVIPAGTLVTTIDGALIYQVTVDTTMYGQYAATYYNASTNRYEITVNLQATSPGTIYNVAPFRINVIPAGLNFDGVEQDIAAAGGTDPESSSGLVTRVINQFKGISITSIAGMVNNVVNYAPTLVKYVSVIRPTDRQEFRRVTNGPALDLCISGEALYTFNEDFVANGGETSVTMQTATAVSVSGLSLNGTALDSTQWSFIPDASPAFQLSTRAVNKIQLNFVLNTNDVIDITGTQNILLDNVQNFVTDGPNALFQTDILVRSFIPLPIVVTVQVQIGNAIALDPDAVQTTILNALNAFIQPAAVPLSLDIFSLTGYLGSFLPVADSFTISVFRRLKGSLSDIETIVPLKNQIPTFDQTGSSVIVST